MWIRYSTYFRVEISSFEMRNISFILAFAVCVSACAPSESSEKSASPAQAADTVKGPLTPAMRAEQLKNDPRITNKNNMTSALRYAETNEFTSIWGALLRRSKWAKEVHNGRFVVLALTNERVAEIGAELIGRLRAPENAQLLNDIMANHLIRSPFHVEKLEKLTELETISGRKLRVDYGQHMIEGAGYYMTQIETSRGSVVWMMDIIDYPEEKLREALNGSAVSQK